MTTLHGLSVYFRVSKSHYLVWSRHWCACWSLRRSTGNEDIHMALSKALHFQGLLELSISFQLLWVTSIMVKLLTMTSSKCTKPTWKWGKSETIAFKSTEHSCIVVRPRSELADFTRWLDSLYSRGGTEQGVNGVKTFTSQITACLSVSVCTFSLVHIASCSLMQIKEQFEAEQIEQVKRSESVWSEVVTLWQWKVIMYWWLTGKRRRKWDGERKRGGGGALHPQPRKQSA